MYFLYLNSKLLYLKINESRIHENSIRSAYVLKKKHLNNPVYLHDFFNPKFLGTISNIFQKNQNITKIFKFFTLSEFEIVLHTVRSLKGLKIQFFLFYFQWTCRIFANGFSASTRFNRFNRFNRSLHQLPPVLRFLCHDIQKEFIRGGADKNRYRRYESFQLYDNFIQ